MDIVVPSYPSIDISYVFDNSNASSNVNKIFLPSSLSAEATAYSVPGVQTAGVRVIQDGDADVALDYEIDLSKASGNTIDVYIVEGNPILWYDKETIVYNPVISEAYFSERLIKIA